MSALPVPRAARELADLLAQSVAGGAAVRAVGCGTRPQLDVDQRAATEVQLSTRGLDQLVAHEPGEQTVTVQAGLELSQLHAVLAQYGQWLPGAGARGTVGGWLACSPDAASDRSCGRPRDRLLGAQAAFSDGTLARGRGRVVKNVAGYDLPRLLAGSLGTLGVLTEVSLKVEPLPPARELLSLRCRDLATALVALPDLHVHPLAPDTLELRLELTACGTAPGCEILIGLAGGLRGVPARREQLAQRVTERAFGDLAALDSATAHARQTVGDEPPGEILLRLPSRPSQLAARLHSLLEVLPRLGTSATLIARPEPAVLLVALPLALPAPLLGELLAACRTTGTARLQRAPAELAAAVDGCGPPPPDLALMAAVKCALDPALRLAPRLGLAGWRFPR